MQAKELFLAQKRITFAKLGKIRLKGVPYDSSLYIYFEFNFYIAYTFRVMH